MFCLCVVIHVDMPQISASANCPELSELNYTASSRLTKRTQRQVFQTSGQNRNLEASMLSMPKHYFGYSCSDNIVQAVLFLW